MPATRFVDFAAAAFALAFISIASAQGAHVVVIAVDTFGFQPNGCYVEEFVNDHDIKGEMNPDPRDFSDQFHGLSAQGIPFDMYTVSVQCEGQFRGSASTWIRHPENSVVVMTNTRRGDYHTGIGPRLTVLLEKTSARATKTEKQRWVTMTGVFLDHRETSQVDARDGVARFYDVFPGRYLLQVIEPRRLVCTRQIDFLEAGASLTMAADDSCIVRSAKSVRVVE